MIATDIKCVYIARQYAACWTAIMLSLPTCMILTWNTAAYVQNYIRPATVTDPAYMELSAHLLPSTVLHILYIRTSCIAVPHLYPASTIPNCPVPSMSKPTTSIPQSTSAVMAPIAARQFCKLQVGPHHPIAGACGVPPAVTLKPIFTPLNADAWAQALHNHPDQAFVAALVDGIRHGFHIGLVPSTACRSSSQTLHLLRSMGT